MHPKRDHLAREVRVERKRGSGFLEDDHGGALFFFKDHRWLQCAHFNAWRTSGEDKDFGAEYRLHPGQECFEMGFAK